MLPDDALRDAKHRQRPAVRERHPPNLLMALVQIALAGLVQHIDVEGAFKCGLHTVAKKHHPVDVKLQQPIHFMRDISQIIALVRHVGLFQDVDFTPDQQRGEK